MQKRFVLLLLALLAGGGHVLAFAPFEFWPASFVSLAVLALLLNQAQYARQGFMLGFAWGFGLFIFGVSWLYIALNRYGGMPAGLAGFSIVLFCAYLALYPALAGTLFVRLHRGSAISRAGLFATLWVFSEWLRGTVFTGFPWLAIGYAHVTPSPLAGYYPLLGVYGVGGIAAFISALFSFAQWRRYADLKTGLMLFTALIALGVGLSFVSWTTPAGPPLNVVLLQTNTAQSLKWNPAHVETLLLKHMQLVRDHPSSLVVFPETTLPLLLDSLPEGYLATLKHDAVNTDGNIVLGIFTRDKEGHIYNSAISLGIAPSQRYAKRHLVPFGEYSPKLFGWFYKLVNIPLSNQTRGALIPPMSLNGQKIAVNICYEDLFGAELLETVPQATLLLNLSNLAWYGDSLAQPQHLQIAQARALETGRPMLRSTNTGMTAIVQPDGLVSHILPAFTQGALKASVSGYQGITPYTRWGDKAVLILAAGFLLLSLWQRKH